MPLEVHPGVCVCAFAPVCPGTAPVSELDYLGQKLAALERPQQLVCQFYRRVCEYVGYILTLYVCVKGCGRNTSVES